MRKILILSFIVCTVVVFFAAMAMAIFCPECGTKNDDTAKFCTNCSKPLKVVEGKEKPKEEPGLTSIVEKVAPSVVLVRTLKNELNAQFKDRGSGFIIDKEGYVLTNAHVVGDPEQLEGINVILADKKECKAQLVLCDYATDLAVLKIKADKLIPVKLGDSEKIIVGDKVFAIGNPMGLEKSTSSGIVSAKDRYLGCYEYEALIQTDAAINPGNSGGPLFNMQGEVIGITSLGFSKLFAEGLNFALPIVLASDIIKSIPTKKIKRPWIGIAVLDITPTLKQWEESVNSRKIVESEGAFVDSIAEGQRLPLKKGDIIIKLNEIPIKKVWDLQREVLKIKIGDEVNIVVKRDGKEQSFKLKTSEKPSQVMFPIEDEVNIMFGATFSTEGNKVKINKVRTGSLAEGRGFRTGGEIKSCWVNRKEGGERIDMVEIGSFHEAFRRAYDHEKRYLEIGINGWIGIHIAISST